MYTVIVAEDELLCRIGLVVSTPWEKMGLRVVAETSNGSAAFDAYLKFKPDIVITDLSMPCMDGFSLIEKIREIDKRCAIIVITCIDRVSSLNKVMQMGVVDYLLKASMTSEDIEIALDKAKKYVGNPGSEESKIDSKRIFCEYTSKYLFEQTLSEEQLLSICKDSGLTFSEKYNLMCVRLWSDNEINSELKETLQSLLSERLQELSIKCIIERENLITILYEARSDSGLIERICHALCDYTETCFGIKLSICAFTASIKRSELQNAAKELILITKMNMCRDNSINWIEWWNDDYVQCVREKMNELRRSILCKSDFAASVHIIDALDELERAWYHKRSLTECIELLSRMLQIYAIHGKAPDVESVNRIVDEPSMIARIEQIQIITDQCLQTYRREICLIIEYIYNNIEGEMSLNKCASLVAIHPQYLSTLFKKEVHVSFTDFQCTTRLMAARWMLCYTTQGLQDIADKCGFADKAYFCRRFKAWTGQTPIEWRRLHQ